MRSLVVLLVGGFALGGLAEAQTGSTSAGAAGRGYVEAVAQSAFGNVTSQSYGGEVGVTVRPDLQVFLDVGKARDVATTEITAAAKTMAGSLSQTEANTSFTVKQPVTFGVIGVKYFVPLSAEAKVQPYVLGGGGVAQVTQDVAFLVGSSDVTSNLTQYGIVLGTDLSGSFTKPMIVLGGGVMWPVWQRLVVDFQYRFGRIYAEDQGINLSRAGIGIGARF